MACDCGKCDECKWNAIEDDTSLDDDLDFLDDD